MLVTANSFSTARLKYNPKAGGNYFYSCGGKGVDVQDGISSETVVSSDSVIPTERSDEESCSYKLHSNSYLW